MKENLQFVFGLFFIMSIACSKQESVPIMEELNNCDNINYNIDYNFDCYTSIDPNDFPEYCDMMSVDTLNKCKTRIVMRTDPEDNTCFYLLLRQRDDRERPDTIWSTRVNHKTPRDSSIIYDDKYVNNKLFIYQYKFLAVKDNYGITCESDFLASR